MSMNVNRTQNTGCAQEAHRQDKRKDSASSDFSELLNSIIAFNPQSEIKVNNAEAPAKEKTERSAEATRDYRDSRPERESSAEAKPTQKTAESSAETKDVKPVEQEAKAEKTAPNTENRAGTTYSVKAGNESGEASEGKPVGEEKSSTEAKSEPMHKPDEKPRITGDSANTSWESQKTEHAVRRAQGEATTAQSGRFTVHSEDSEQENTAAARTWRQSPHWRALAADTDTVRTENATDGVKYAGVRGKDAIGNLNVGLTPHNLLPNIDPRLPMRGNSKLEGMIEQAAKQLGDVSITNSENKLPDTAPKIAQPLIQPDKLVGKTETASTAIADGMEKDEAIAAKTVFTPAEHRNTSFGERMAQIEAQARQTVKNRDVRPETNPEAYTATGTRDTTPVTETRTQPATPVRQPEMPDQARQIQAEVIRGLENEKMEFRMQLQPQELGKIDVKMALQDGKLTLEIVSSARASEMLSRQLDNLAASIKQNSPELSSVQIVNAAREASPGQLDSSLNANASNTGHGQSGESKNSGNGKHHETAEYEDNGTTPEPARLLDYAV